MATAPTTGIGATPVLANVEVRGASQQIAPAAGSEQRLIDYIAHLQSQGVTSPSFSNPQALVGEAMKSLKGYFERANGMNDHLSVKGKRMDKSENAALAVDFLKFMTSKENAAKLTADIGWLSPVQGSATAENSFPQLQAALADISKASQFAIWLDTVTNAEVANAYLSGVEGLIDGSKTSKDVVSGVQQAAAKAKKQVG